MLHLHGLTSFIDQVAEETLAQRKIAGVSVSVSHRGQLVHSNGYGYADVKRRIYATAATIYSLGSMTKQFTSVAVLRLAERGSIELDAPIATCLPLKCPVTSPASIRDVLTHTAGIRGDLERMMLADSRDSKALTREGVLALVTDELFDARPRDVWRYSNFGYYLLGIVIEEVSGMSYAEYLTTDVLLPAGLSNTAYVLESLSPDRLAQGYTEDDDAFASVDLPSSQQTFASGGLFSNVLDLQQWRVAVQDGRLLSERSYMQMTAPAILSNGQPTSYGLGFFLGACGSYREIGHDSTSGGFSGQSAYYPEADLSVVVLMNCERHEAERLEKRISRRVLGVEEPNVESAEISISGLAKYVGKYIHKGLEVPVELQGSRLTISIPKRRPVELLYQGNDTFAQGDDLSTRFEFAVHSAHADSFTVIREGKAIANARRLS